MDYQKCTKCNQRKKESEFNWRDQEKTWRHRMCKKCHSQYRKDHYQKNRQKYINKAMRWNSSQKKKIYEFLFAYLKDHPCVDCGEKDVIVLDFDHKENKKMEISSMSHNCHSIESIKKEIGKCEVRCANCHRRRTSQERKYWKTLMGG